MAIVVRGAHDENTLYLLSSEAFKGPNIREDIGTLKNYSWDVYRLNQWDRVDKMRFYEFVNLVRQKAERWYGYDFPVCLAYGIQISALLSRRTSVVLIAAQQ